MTAAPTLFLGHRIGWSRVAVILVFAFAVFVPTPDIITPRIQELSELLGFGLLVVAALGRLWCLSFIAGFKNEVLVTEGPYSVVRNPLYVFNFIGAVGFGLAVENPLLAALLALGFFMLYPGVVRLEEERMEQLFGESFARYREATPRWLPQWSNFHEPETWTINPQRFRAGLVNAMWFLWAFMLWEVFEEFGILLWLRGL